MNWNKFIDKILNWRNKPKKNPDFFKHFHNNSIALWSHIVIFEFYPLFLIGFRLVCTKIRNLLLYRLLKLGICDALAVLELHSRAHQYFLHFEILDSAASDGMLARTNLLFCKLTFCCFVFDVGELELLQQFVWFHALWVLGTLAQGYGRLQASHLYLLLLCLYTCDLAWLYL